MIYLLFIFLVTSIVVDLLRNKKIYSPVVVFNGMFFIALFLYNFYLSYLQQILSSKTIWIITLFIIAFNLIFIKDLYKPKRQIIYIKRDISFRISAKREMVAYYVALAIFIVEVIYSKGCPLLWKFTGSEKTYVDFGIASVNGMFYGLVILMGAYSLFKKGCIYKYCYLAFGVLIISRQMLISMFVQAIILYLLTHKLNKKIVIGTLIGIVLAILAFSFMGNMRTGESEFLKVAKFKPQYDWIPTSIKWVYSYVCFSFSNLNKLFSLTNGCVNLGALTLNELVPNIFNLHIPITRHYSFDYLVSKNFTVSTFVPILYLDFGVIGLCIFCLIIAHFAKNFYERAENNEMVSKLVYMVIVHNIIFLFFINMFLYLPILFEFFLIPIIFVLDYDKLKNKIFKNSKGGKV